MKSRRRGTLSPALVLIAILAGACVWSCNRTPEARLARFMATGKRHLEKKDYPRAVLDFQNAVRLAPNDPEAFYYLALARLEAGDYRAGVAYLRKATELNPKHVGAQVKLAQMMATSRRSEILEEAEERAQAAFAVSPEDAAVLNTLALTELRLGKPEDARQHLEQALAKFPGNLQSSVMLANLKLAEKDLAGAEEVLKKAAAQAPKSAEPRLALAHFYSMQGKFDQAEQETQKGLKVDPKHGPSLLQLARLQLRAKRMDDADRTYRRISVLPDKTYRSAHAVFLVSQGKLAEATTELEKIHREDPSDRDVRSRLVATYLMNQRATDAETVLTAAVKRNPRDIVALTQRGALWSRTGKLVEAEQDLRKALQLEPVSAEAHYHLAAVHRARGETAQAKQELGESLRLRVGLLAARLELAQMLIRENSARAALDLLDQAPAAQKSDLGFIVARNWALIGLGSLAEARKGIDRGLAIARTVPLLTQDATLKLATKDAAGAGAALEEALKVDPENLPALELLLLSYAAQNRLPAGLERVRRIAAERPRSAPLQLYLGTSLLRAGKRDEARAAFQAAKKADPNSPAPDLRLAQLDYADGKLEAARTTLTALVSARTPSVEARMLLGGVEERAGNHAAAIEHFRKVVEVAPRNVLALNNLAYLLVDRAGQPDEGLQHAQKAKELAPNSLAIEDTIGWAYYHKGLYRTAIAHLESAVSKGGGTPVRRYHLAMAYLKNGDFKRGQQALETALKMDPNLPEAQAARLLLAEARRR